MLRRFVKSLPFRAMISRVMAMKGTPLLGPKAEQLLKN
jgi:hypothetical protein